MEVPGGEMNLCDLGMVGRLSNASFIASALMSPTCFIGNRLVSDYRKQICLSSEFFVKKFGVKA